MMIPVSLFRLNADHIWLYKPEYTIQQSITSCWWVRFPSTYAVCLGHIYIAVCVIIHLLVDATDSLEAEENILILAKWLINATQICGETQSYQNGVKRQLWNS